MKIAIKSSTAENSLENSRSLTASFPRSVFLNEKYFVPIRVCAATTTTQHINIHSLRQKKVRRKNRGINGHYSFLNTSILRFMTSNVARGFTTARDQSHKNQLSRKHYDANNEHKIAFYCAESTKTLHG